MLVIPGTLADSNVRGKRFALVARGRFVLVSKVVEQFFDTDRIGPRQLVVLRQILADFAVGSRVDVDRKGAERFLGHAKERVVDDSVVLFTPLSRPDSPVGVVCFHAHRSGLAVK